MLSLVVGAAFFPAAALGADSIYWDTGGGGKISVARLDGSGGEDISTGKATVVTPNGTALDPGAGRIYWANPGASKISFANLDDGSGGDLNTGAATVSIPVGVTVDPVAGRIYWANVLGNKISFANLDGSGGGDLNTGAATVEGPEGVAVDPAAGRIYWANFSANKISFANLNGSGGGDLNTGAATVDRPEGLALDPAVGRIFWSNPEGDAISFANLDGSGGGGDLVTGQPVLSPTGLAIDPEVGRIYWANRIRGGGVLFANVDGSGGGGTVKTGTANVEGPTFPVLLLSPRPQASPEITGGSTAGSVLSCSRGTWAPDLVASFLYRAPQSFAFQWSLDGTDIPGAQQSSLTASSEGEYRCRVTARNHAGSSAQTSVPQHISSAPLLAFGPDTKVTLTLLAGRVLAHGPVKVQIANANAFAITGTLSGQSTKPISKARKRPVRLGTQTFKVAAEGKATVILALPKPLQLLLARQHRLSLSLSATVTDPAANHRTVQKTVAPKLQTKPRGG